MRKTLTILCMLALGLSCVAGQPQEPFSVEKNKIELEQMFWDGLMVFRPKGKMPRPGNLQRIDENLYVSENGCYESEDVQNTAFFRKNLFIWQPVCESARPAESLMTLLTAHTGKKAFTVHLLQHRYGYASAETEIPLALLLEYCLENGCTPYVGIESAEDEELSATLFMVNHALGYCHTFHFTVNRDVLDRDEGLFEAEAYTYTPIETAKP